MEAETITPGGDDLNTTSSMDPSTTPGKYFLFKKLTMMPNLNLTRGGNLKPD